LWDVDGYHGTARARAGSHGRPAAALRLSGDPIGWVWEQGMRLRVEPTPRWSRPGLVVVAERLRRDDDHGLIVTYTFEPPDLPTSELVFDEAAVYLRGVLALQESQASAAAGRRRVTALLHGLRRIPGELELDTLAADLCGTAMAITDATGAAVGMWDGEQGEVLAVAGADGGPVTGDIFVPPESELAIAIRADTMLVRNAADWSLGRTAVVRPGEAWISRPRTLAALPLRGAAGVIGVLAVWSSTSRELDSDALELLHALAPYAALHMEHARAFGRMRETAERDPLTLLRNRRSFDEIFTAETVRFERYGRPLSLLVLDLDHFKAINDRHGHEAGDEVLRRVAQSITACIRDIDTAARVGGEEFIVLLPETGAAAAVDVAERIRQTVARTPIEWRGTGIDVRTSIGVAACPDTVGHPRDLVSSGDRALYAAKAAGRDRVMLAAAADVRSAAPRAPRTALPLRDDAV
jgi:diguanylate cyclase (GGDEF)-like protein